MNNITILRGGAIGDFVLTLPAIDAIRKAFATEELRLIGNPAILALYGNAIIVNTDFARENAAKVTGFLRAVAKGWKDAIANPAAGAAMVAKRNPAADVALETRRLKLSINSNVVTDYTKANGLGNIDKRRMAKAMNQLAQNYKFVSKPNMSKIFTDAYLPKDGSLMLK